MAKPKHKSMRNQPEMYDEIKKPFTFSLTQTAVKELELLAKIHGISRSEIVEQFARGQIKLQTLPPTQTNH
ncbi:ribbon-helix-helix domain-containing protein [Microcoleus sp. Pol7_A1]|uniref:ribbon-helix-helix domain-containing protein n=1 Tax=Microcoleus sp. Pol7_A1 TaxID=2818893 RepID=UPI002FD1143C